VVLFKATISLFRRI